MINNEKKCFIDFIETIDDLRSFTHAAFIDLTIVPANSNIRVIKVNIFMSIFECLRIFDFDVNVAREILEEERMEQSQKEGFRYLKTPTEEECFNKCNMMFDEYEDEMEELRKKLISMSFTSIASKNEEEKEISTLLEKRIKLIVKHSIPEEDTEENNRVLKK